MKTKDNVKDVENQLKKYITDAKNNEALKQILHILGGPFSYTEIWEHRYFFISMQEETVNNLPVKNIPAYCAIMAVIKMLEFDLPGARILQKQLPTESLEAYYLWAVIPKTEEQWKKGLDRVIREFPNEISTHHITLGRPTIYNGIWCMANFGNDFLQEGYIKELFSRCNSEKGQGIYEILMSEICYQRNACFDALSLEVANSYRLEHSGNISGLFVGVYIQMCVMIVTGQLRAVQYVMEEVSKKVQSSVSTEVQKNEKALAAWCALYDRNYQLIGTWMNECSPNEYRELCLLDEYKKEKRFKDEIFLKKLISMSQKMGILFPGYMKREAQLMEELTENEIDVLRQLAADQTNGEIAEYLHISLNTVKYYTKQIYGKLGVKNRQKAVKNAKDLGIL